MPGADGHAAHNTKRRDLRMELISGKSRNTGKPLQEEQKKQKWPDLLRAHYQCVLPGPSACLQDALHMITTGKVRITCLGAIWRPSAAHLGPLWYQSGTNLIRIWYQSGTNLVHIWYQCCT